jgi:hypothetical protein
MPCIKGCSVECETHLVLTILKDCMWYFISDNEYVGPQACCGWTGIGWRHDASCQLLATFTNSRWLTAWISELQATVPLWPIVERETLKVTYRGLVAVEQFISCTSSIKDLHEQWMIAGHMESGDKMMRNRTLDVFASDALGTQDCNASICHWIPVACF